MVNESVILAHFKRYDPILFSFFETIKLPPLVPRHPNEYLMSLCREIIGQQLSGKVAQVIFFRFEKLFAKTGIAPDVLLRTSEDVLRTTGMSWSKTRFIRDLALKVHSGDVDLGALIRLSDQEVVAELTKVKGVGPWTSEMFLIFTLGRLDVFSYGDLGLRRAIQTMYKYRKEPTLKQMEKLSNRWKPYRSYAALALWKFKDG